MLDRQRHLGAAIAALVLLAACGAPGRVETLDRTGDFGRVEIPLTHALPDGLSDAGVDGPRLVAGCTALEPRVTALVPGANGAGGAAQFVSTARFVSRHCEWSGSRGTVLAVGMIDRSGASSDLDETILFIDDDRAIAGVGQRAVYDPQTRTLFVVISDRLWYAQLVGAAPTGPSALPILVALGRELANTPAAR